MSDWIIKNVFVPSLIGAACGAFFDSLVFMVGVSLMLIIVWNVWKDYLFEESVNTEDSG
jgi:hypothetical protein